MTRLTISTTGVGVGDIARIADGMSIGIAPEVVERLGVARDILDRAAEAGQQIYGLNTGLGANIGSSVSEDPSAFQRSLVDGRSAGVGEALPDRDVRAIIAARIVMLAQGGSGISAHVFDALVAMLNAGVTPIVPRFGSIGAGDLVMLAPIAEVLVGGGKARFDGVVIDGTPALAAAGLLPVSLAPKDGLSLINASSVSVGLGALGIVEASHLLARQVEAAALTMAGIGANRSILDERINRARPAGGQVDAAARLSDLLGPTTQATKLQDPLSMRCAPSILGALDHAIASAREAIELELNSAGDNPLVLVNDRLVLSTGNFHTPAIALAFETLGLAIAQCASASAARFVQLTGSGRGGLPKYLSPVGGASAGFVPLQKTVAALTAAIRQKANPVMLDFFAVSEGVEDHAPQTALAIDKCRDMIALWRDVVAFELLAAAQAVDLRKGCTLPPALQSVHDVVRSVSVALAHDRPLGRDVRALSERLRPSGDMHKNIKRGTRP